MEMQRLEIDLEAGILKINSEDFISKLVVVTLPGPEGWPLARLFNAELAVGNPEGCATIEVTYTAHEFGNERGIESGCNKEIE